MSPATRTWKNSSRCSLTIARNLPRSSSGTFGVFGEREDTRDEVEEGELSVEVAHADGRSGLGFGPHADSDVDAAHSSNSTG